MKSTSLRARLRKWTAQELESTIAVSDGQKQLSYAELLVQVDIASSWLQRHRVTSLALHCDNCVEWVVFDLACQTAGIVCVPLPEFFSEAQLNACLEATKTDLLVQRNSINSHIGYKKVDSPFSLSILQPENMKSEFKDSNFDISVPLNTSKITFTSGSTGAPKGVCLSAEHQWQTASAIAQCINIDKPKHLCLLPLATLLENVAGVYAPLLKLGTVIVCSEIERGLSGSSGLHLSTLLSCISIQRPSSIILLPQLLSALVTACKTGWVPPTSLEFIAVGGAKVSSQLLFDAQACGLPVYQGYGLSECGSVVALNTSEQTDIGKVGKILPHVDAEICDGEIVISKSIFLGYLNEPSSWYPKKVMTGDLGSIEHDRLSVDGRIKNLIISGYGRNISPEWIECELTGNGLIQQCVVIGEGRPHLSAFISVSDRIDDQSIQTWINTVNKELPDYARVLAWKRLAQHQWNSVLTANGKPQRKKINSILESEINALYEPQTVNRSHQNLSLTEAF